MNILESRLDAVPMEINSSEHLRKDKEQNGAEIFRIGKVKTKDILTNLLVYKEEINQLEKQSKQLRGEGYSIVCKERVFDKIGKRRSGPDCFSEADHIQWMLDRQLGKLIVNHVMRPADS